MNPIVEKLFKNIETELNKMLDDLDDALLTHTASGNEFDDAGKNNLKAILGRIDSSLIGNPHIKKIMAQGTVEEQKKVKEIIDKIENEVKTRIDFLKNPESSIVGLSENDAREMDSIFTEKVSDSQTVTTQRKLDEANGKTLEAKSVEDRYKAACKKLEKLKERQKLASKYTDLKRTRTEIKSIDDILNSKTISQRDLDAVDTIFKDAENLPDGAALYHELQALLTLAKNKADKNIKEDERKADYIQLRKIMDSLRKIEDKNPEIIPLLDALRKATNEDAFIGKTIDVKDLKITNYVNLKTALKVIAQGKLTEDMLKTASADKKADLYKEAANKLKSVGRSNPICQLIPETEGVMDELAVAGNDPVKLAELKTRLENILKNSDDAIRQMRDDARDKDALSENIKKVQKLIKALEKYREGDPEATKKVDTTIEVYGKKIKKGDITYKRKKTLPGGTEIEEDVPVDLGDYETLTPQQKAEIRNKLFEKIAPRDDDGKITWSDEIDGVYESVAGDLKPKGVRGFFSEIRFAMKNGMTQEDARKIRMVENEISRQIRKAVDKKDVARRSEADANKWKKVSPEVQDKIDAVIEESRRKRSQEIVMGGKTVDEAQNAAQTTIDEEVEKIDSGER